MLDYTILAAVPARLEQNQNRRDCGRCLAYLCLCERKYANKHTDNLVQKGENGRHNKDMPRLPLSSLSLSQQKMKALSGKTNSFFDHNFFLQELQTTDLFQHLDD